MVNTFRDLTQDEAEKLKAREHQRRTADRFQCPHCDFITGASTFVTEACMCECTACGQEFFAWAEPGLIHITARP